MFGLVLIAAVTTMHGYVLWRARSVPFLRRRMSGKMLAAAGLALWVLFLLGRVHGHDSPGVLAGVLELASMVWMVTVFLISVPLLFVDAITGFGILLSGAAHRMREAAVVTGILLSVVSSSRVYGSRWCRTMMYGFGGFLPRLTARCSSACRTCISVSCGTNDG